MISFLFTPSFSMNKREFSSICQRFKGEIRWVIQIFYQKNCCSYLLPVQDESLNNRKKDKRNRSSRYLEKRRRRKSGSNGIYDAFYTRNTALDIILMYFIFWRFPAVLVSHNEKLCTSSSKNEQQIFLMKYLDSSSNLTSITRVDHENSCFSLKNQE